MLAFLTISLAGLVQGTGLCSVVSVHRETSVKGCTYPGQPTHSDNHNVSKCLVSVLEMPSNEDDPNRAFLSVSPSVAYDKCQESLSLPEDLLHEDLLADDKAPTLEIQNLYLSGPSHNRVDFVFFSDGCESTNAAAFFWRCMGLGDTCLWSRYLRGTR
jgi:hypothetical protein